MSFETNTDYVSLNVPDASRKDKKRFSMSKPKSTARQRPDKEKQKKTRDRVNLRKKAREEYRTLARLAEIQNDRSAIGKGKGKQPMNSEQESSAESSTAAATYIGKKKRKSKVDVDLLPELLEQARQNPDFRPPSMSMQEMQENLRTGSEKRAAKRQLKEDEKEVKLLKKREKKKRAKRNKQAEEEGGGEDQGPSFFVDTEGAR